MARKFSIAFDTEFTEEMATREVAQLISQALDAEFDHSLVFAQPLDEIDGSVIGDWVGEEEDDDVEEI